MNCQKVRENLLEYQRDQLSKDFKREIAKHLESCSSCGVQFQQFQQVEAELDRLVEIEPSRYFDQKLSAKLDELVKLAPCRNRLFLWLQERYALSFVLLLLTTLGAWVGFRHQQGQKLKSMEDVLEVQERYLGSGTSTAQTETRPSIGAAQSKPSVHVRTDPSSTEDEVISDTDLAVLENYDLLRDYDFLKKFDLADLQSEGR
jgi:predicted anti-sigma-YlaC factor YlaD